MSFLENYYYYYCYIFDQEHLVSVIDKNIKHNIIRMNKYDMIIIYKQSNTDREHQHNPGAFS